MAARTVHYAESRTAFGAFALFCLFAFVVITAHAFLAILFRTAPVSINRTAANERVNIYLSPVEGAVISAGTDFILADPTVFLHGGDDLSFGVHRMNKAQNSDILIPFANPFDNADGLNNIDLLSVAQKRNLSDFTAFADPFDETEVEANSKVLPLTTEYPRWIFPSSVKSVFVQGKLSDKAIQILSENPPSASSVFRIEPPRDKYMPYRILLVQSCGNGVLDKEGTSKLKRFFDSDIEFSGDTPFTVVTVWTKNKVETEKKE